MEAVLLRQRLYASLFTSSSEKILVVVHVEELTGKGSDNKRKPRLLCLTSKGDNKVRLYKIKDIGNGQFKESQVWRLEDVQTVENAPEPSLQFMLVFNKGSSFVGFADTLQDRDELMWAIVLACRKYIGALPKLRNVDETRLSQQSNQHSIQSVAQRLARQKLSGGDSSQDIKTSDGLAINGGVDNDEDDAEDLDEDAAFLATFDWSLSDPAALEHQLFGELNGLDSANVYALIQCDNDLEMALEKVDNALEELDTLEIVLKRFNNQLERLGQDIKQIEKQNNANQVQTTNQRVLLDALKETMSMLSVPASQLDILTTGSFDSERDVEKMVTAAKLLRETLTMQFPGGMGLMSAIDEKLDEFREKRQRFSARIADHIEKIVESEMDACLNDKTRLSKKGEFRLFSHAHVHARLARLQPFADWLAAIDAHQLMAIQKAYCKNMGRVYKRELKEFFEALKQSLAASASSEDNDAKGASLFHSVSSNKSRRASMISRPSRTVDSSKMPQPVRKESVKRANNFPEAFWSFVVGSEESLSVAEAFRRVVHMFAPICAGEEQFVSRFFPAAVLEPLYRNQRQSSLFSGIPPRLGSISGSDNTSMLDLNGASSSDLLGSAKHSSKAKSIYEGKNVDDDAKSIRSVRPKSIFEGRSGGGRNSVILEEGGRLGGGRNSVMFDDAALDRSDSASIGGGGGGGGSDAFAHDQSYMMSTVAKTLNDGVSVPLFTLFESLSTEIAMTVESALKNNPVMALPLMGAISSARQTEEDQRSSYFMAIMDVSEKTKILSVFDKFISEQVKQLQEHSLLVPKYRDTILKPVINFAGFIDYVELSIGAKAPSESVRKLINDTYRRLAQALMDSVVIRDDQMQVMEEKEQRQLHIAIVENCHHFFSQLHRFKNAGLDDFMVLSRSAYDARLASYVAYVCRRSLGKLNEFFSGVDTMLESRKDEEVGFSLSYNKNACRKVIREFSAKDLKKELSDLYRRVQRDWSEDEGLQPIVWRSVQEELIRLYRHFTNLIDRCYPQSGIGLAFTIENILAASSDAGSISGSGSEKIKAQS